MIHQRVFYFISELILVLNRYKDTSLSTIEFIWILLRSYVKLPKHIYFCELVYLELFKNVDFAKVIGFKPHDNFALKYQLNKDKFPCYVKIVKVTDITI